MLLLPKSLLCLWLCERTVMKNSSKAEAGESKEAVERKTDHLLSRLRALEAAKGVAPVANLQRLKMVKRPENKIRLTILDKGRQVYWLTIDTYKFRKTSAQHNAKTKKNCSCSTETKRHDCRQKRRFICDSKRKQGGRHRRRWAARTRNARNLTVVNHCF